jgi:hypothetical protein
VKLRDRELVNIEKSHIMRRGSGGKDMHIFMTVLTLTVTPVSYLQVNHFFSSS